MPGSGCPRRELAPRVWIKACAWSAWVLAIPVVGFGLFFLNALLSSTGPWNPATDEAVLVPLAWLGSLLLPLPLCLHQAAAKVTDGTNAGSAWGSRPPRFRPVWPVRHYGSGRLGKR